MPKLLKNLYNGHLEKARGRFRNGTSEKAFLDIDYGLLRTGMAVLVMEDA